MAALNIGTELEKNLIEKIREGDHAAMKRLYDIFSGCLFAICRRYIPDKDTAEDVFQDSFVKILTSFGKFDYKGKGSLQAWMSRVTVNEALQYLRQKKKCSFVERTENLPDIMADDEDVDVDGIPPAVIQRLIGELPDGYRTIFNLYAIEERSHREIAAMLGITESTSASQFFRARKMLAKKINDYTKNAQ